MEAFFADIDEARHLLKGSDSSPTKREPELALYTPSERSEVEQLTAKLNDFKQTLEGCSPDEAAALKRRIKATEADLDLINKNALWTMITVSIEPRPIRVLPRGNWLDDSGAIVQPAVPQFLGKVGTQGRATRLDLANWLTDPAQGSGTLTARVMANRFWYLTFGEGLARVLSDFGGQGEPPTHPELLDNLAVEFVESGWDIKHMMRLLVTSRAYRQSSLVSDALRQRDPENRLLARQARLRLPAEMIRDNALAISGLLIEQVGGRSVRPYQPAGYYRLLNFPKRTYEHDQDTGQWRRGLYVHWQRQFLHPMLKAFDAPRREECTAQRSRSNTPLAALTLLNDPTFVEAARVFAVNILREDGYDARLRYAFRRATSREPDAWERERLGQIVEQSRAEYRQAPDRAQELIQVGQAPLPQDIDPIELAAWTTLARALLNLNETITRN
jgi:hypothetical protein